MEVGLVLMLALITGAIIWLRNDAALTPSHVLNEAPDAPAVSHNKFLQEAFPAGGVTGSRKTESKQWFGKIFELSGAPLDRRYTILRHIAADQPLNYDQLEDTFEVSRKTIKRDLKALKDLNLITFTGAPKTGKYIFTEYGRITWQTL